MDDQYYDHFHEADGDFEDDEDSEGASSEEHEYIEIPICYYDDEDKRISKYIDLHVKNENITKIVENYNDNITEVVIKDGVRSIDHYAFAKFPWIRSITIPNSVTSIGNYAFYGLSKLETIDIPNSVKSIGRRAFRYCTSLQAIVIPKGITAIEEGAFSVCPSLHKVTLPPTIEEFGSRAFCMCGALEQVDIPNGITRIPEHAFEGCTSLRNVTLPPTIEEFGSRAFRYCEALEQVDLPNGITRIPEYAFFCCKSLRMVTLPPTMEEFGSSAFCDCEALEQVDIPNGITRIPENAFFGCKSLRTVTLPPTIEEVGSRAFCHCEALEQVDIPNGITRIPEQAFWGCTSLRTVTLPPTIEEFGSYAFYRCVALEQVDIPYGLPALKDGFAPFNLCFGSRTFELVKQILENASSVTSMTLKYDFGNIEDDHLGKVLELVSACPTLREVDLPRNHLSVGVFEKLASQDIPGHLRLLQIKYNVEYSPWGHSMEEPEQHRKEWKEASSSPKHLLEVLERNPKLVIKTDKFWDDSVDEKVRHHLDMNEYGCRGFTLRDSRWPELIETLHTLEEEEKLQTGAANILYHLLHRHMDRQFLSHWQSDMLLDMKESGTSEIDPNRESTGLNNDPFFHYLLRLWFIIIWILAIALLLMWLLLFLLLLVFQWVI